MLVDVRFVSRPVLSAPQTRSASLPRHLLSCCSSAPPPPSPAPPRARPFDPACRVKQLSIRCFSPPYGSASCCCWCAGRGQGGGEARVAPPSRSSAPSGRRPAPALRPLPRAAGRSSRPLCGKVACSLSRVLGRVVDSVVRLTGEKGRGEEAPVVFVAQVEICSERVLWWKRLLCLRTTEVCAQE